MKKKILITGANGCIGSELVHELLSRNHEIFALALDKNDTDKIKNFKQVKILYGDICDLDRMFKIFHEYNFDVVIHLAALVHKPESKEEDFIRVNFLATKNLFNLSKDNNVNQFIFISTVAVYGEEGSRKRLNEDDPVKPQSFYAKSKYKAEEYIKNNCNNINYTIIRPTTVYGKHDKGNIHTLISIARKGIIPVFGKGTNFKSFVFSKNLVKGIADLIDNPEAFNETFIISDNDEYSINQINKTIKKVLGQRILIIHFPFRVTIYLMGIINKLVYSILKRNLVSLEFVSKLTTSQTFDISKSKKLLKYNPEYTLEDGLDYIYTNINNL